MIQEIKYNGYTQSPSDYISPDGDLDGAIGLVPEDNVLKPVHQPGVEFRLEPGQQVVYVHDPSFVHYIVKNSDNGFVWYEKDDKGDLKENSLYDFSDNEVYQVTSVGNTLIILASDGMHYFLWKADKGTSGDYEYLGMHLPELDLSFGLQGELAESEEFRPAGKTYDDRLSQLTDEEKATVTNAVLGQVNKLVAEKGTEAGKFVFPFLVRYAMRLYDGTLTMQSSPVLMLPSFGGTSPLVQWEAITHGAAKVKAFVHSLDYRTVRGKEVLQDWKDIVSSIDVFISSPFYLYDQSGKVEKLSGGEGYFSIHKLADSDETPDKGLYGLDTSQGMVNYLYSDTVIKLPKKDITDTVKSCSTFFFLSSINIDDLALERTKVKIGKNYLTNLDAKEDASMGAIYAHETLPDDYVSHESIVSKYAYAFNARINLTGISKAIAPMGSPLSRFCFANADLAIDLTPHLTTGTASLKAEVERDGRKMVVKSEADAWPSGIQMPWYIYHSDGKTKNVYLERSNITPSTIKFPMKSHELLNGAVHYNGDKYNLGEDYNDRFAFGTPEEEVTTTPAITDENIIELPNKIYTSEINNPFYFPLTGINTVGAGEIKGICAATKALSQGQFGQFPLYAFTSEGVWALETTATGTYSARQPITRDVCTNPESITQLDNAVLFATDRGVMMLSGSQSVCITDTLRSYDSLDLEQNLPSLKDVAGAHLVPTVPFMEYLPGIKILYDYNHQRIVMFNAAHDYAYVYSLDSKMWGMMASDLKSAVNSYPEALAMDGEGRLLNFAKSQSGTVNALLVTRPLKLGAADIQKTIDTIIQRGQFRRGHVASILYGSRDLYNWHLVYSSQDHYLRGFRGTPYKYYRVALVCELADGESLVGCSVQYTARLDNQPR